MRTDEPTDIVAGLPLESDEPREELEFREYFEVFRRYKWIFLAIVCTIIICGTLFTVTRRKIYQSEAELDVVTQSTSGGKEGSDPVLTSIMALGQGRNVETQVAIISSRDLLQSAFNKLSKQEKLAGFGSESLPTWAYEIGQKRQTDIITVTTSSYKPELAARLANQIANTYLERDQERNSAAARLARIFVEQEKVDLQEKLNTATDEFAKYQVESKLISPSVQVDEGIKELYDSRAIATTAQASIAASDRQLALIDQQIKAASPELQASRLIQENPRFSLLQSKIADLRQQLTNLETVQDFTETSPEVVNKKAEIRAALEELSKIPQTFDYSIGKIRNPILEDLLKDYAVIKSEKLVSDEKLRYANQIIGERTRDMLNYPNLNRVYTKLQQNVAELERTVSSLSDRYYALLIQERSNLPNGVITSPAAIAGGPSSPQVTRSIVLITLLALLVGISVIFAVDKFDTHLHDPQSINRYTGLTTLAAVPETKSVDPENERLFIGSVENNHAFIESFRLLRNNIAFTSPGRTFKVIAITSPGKSEGKSTVCVNLAIAIGMDGHRVLLVDADLRRPSIHAWMGVSRDVGFTSVVVGHSTLDAAVIPTKMENVFCLPSGPLPPNPTEFLNSAKARQVIEEAKTKFDVVVLDCPPSTGLSDTQVISTMVDGMILVVALNTTLRPHLMATTTMLRQAKAPLIGSVLNRIDYRRNTYGYYSYYYYYYYSGYEEEQPKKPKRMFKK